MRRETATQIVRCLERYEDFSIRWLYPIFFGLNYGVALAAAWRGTLLGFAAVNFSLAMYLQIRILWHGYGRV